MTKLMKIVAEVLAIFVPPNIGEQAMNRLESRLAKATKAGDMKKAAFITRQIDNRKRNPIVARLTLSYTPSIAEALKEAEGLERDPSLTDDDSKASFGLHVPTPTGDVLHIDITEGMVSQLKKNLPSFSLLKTYGVGCEFQAFVELRHIGDVVPDTTPEGRLTGGEITIQQGSAAIVNPEIVVDAQTAREVAQIMYNAEFAYEQSQMNARRGKRDRTVADSSNKKSSPDVFVAPKRKQGLTNDQYDQIVSDAKDAWELKHGGEIPIGEAGD